MTVHSRTYRVILTNVNKPKVFGKFYVQLYSNFGLGYEKQNFIYCEPYLYETESY